MPSLPFVFILREAPQKKMLLKYEFFPKGGGGSRPIQKFRGTFFEPHNCQKGGGQKESKSFEAVLR